MYLLILLLFSNLCKYLFYFLNPLYNYGFIPENYPIRYTLQMSTMIEIVILSLAMIYKHKILDDQSKNNLLEVEKLRFSQELEAKEKIYLQQKHQLEHEKMEEILSFKERELAIRD